MEKKKGGKVSHTKVEKRQLAVIKVVVILTLTRIIKSVVIGQDPVTLELRNTPGKKAQTKRKVVHAYITADAIIHASARNIQQ